MALDLEPVYQGTTLTDVPLWINGAAQPGSVTRTSTAPATGAPFAHVQWADRTHVEAAVAAASAAQPGWAAMPISDRAAVVSSVAARIREHAQQLGLVDAHDTGTPIRTMRTGAQKGADYLSTTAGVAMEVQGRTIPASASGWHLTFPRPLGVVAAIAAFNHPILFACQKIGPALVAGNTVVLKSSELAPVSTSLLARLTADLLPPGVLNVLAGGADVGDALVSHPDTAAVTFTGSVASGQAIALAAARTGKFKRLVLELGGKNPILVYPDADLDHAADAVVRGMNYTRNQGQSCGSTSRLLVHRNIHDELIERVLQRVGRISMGLPDREETEMGSLIRTEHRDRLLSEIEQARGDGANVAIGGSAPDHAELAQGAYLEPTVVTAVDRTMPIAGRELFGPVLAVIECADDAAMIETANDTELGLTAAIWTADIDRALHAAERIEAGYLWVNDVETRYKGVPHGGWKQSGVGLEQALTDEIREFTRTKSVNIAIRSPA